MNLLQRLVSVFEKPKPIVYVEENPCSPEDFASFLQEVSEISKPEPLVNIEPIKAEIRFENVDRVHSGEVPIKGWNPSEIALKKPMAIKGWKLIGVFEYSASHGQSPIGNIQLIQAFGEDVPIEYTKNPAKCDVCKKDMHRKWTFIVKNVESGKIIQAGSVCMKKFFKEI